MHGGMKEVGERGCFRLWSDSDMHQRLKKGFESDKLYNEGGDLRKSKLMARYYNELQGKERCRKTSERLL